MKWIGLTLGFQLKWNWNCTDSAGFNLFFVSSSQIVLLIRFHPFDRIPILSFKKIKILQPFLTSQWPFHHYRVNRTAFIAIQLILISRSHFDIHSIIIKSTNLSVSIKFAFFHSLKFIHKILFLSWIRWIPKEKRGNSFRKS